MFLLKQIVYPCLIKYKISATPNILGITKACTFQVKEIFQFIRQLEINVISMAEQITKSIERNRRRGNVQRTYLKEKHKVELYERRQED